MNAQESIAPPPILFDAYDRALVDFFSIKVYPNISNQDEFEVLKPVLPPFRIEFANQPAITKTEDNSNPLLNKIVRVPAMALSQLNWEYDLTRWAWPNFRKLGNTEDGLRGFQSDQPVPVDIMYQLDVWTKYRTTMNQITRSIMTKFTHREVWLKVDLGGVWGVKTIPIVIGYGGPKNLTNLEPDDKDPKIRMAWTFILQAWMVPDPISTPLVRTIKEVGIRDGEVIDEYIIASTRKDLPIGEENP